MQPPYDDNYADDPGPEVMAPTDERARAILDGFHMCALIEHSTEAAAAALPDAYSGAAATQRLDEHVGR